MNHSYLLLFLSEYREKNTEELYQYEKTGRYYKGTQTCDAPVKVLMECALADGKPVDSVICIVSDYILHGSNREGVRQNGRALENLKKVVSEYAEEIGTACPDILQVRYDFDENGKLLEGEEIQKSIYSGIIRYIGTAGAGASVYIDYTGGMRDVSFLMTSVIKYIEFTGATCRKIVYAYHHEKEHTVSSLDKVYGMYRLINGVSEFSSTGSTIQLLQYFNSKGGNANRIVQSMQNFSDSISLCDINGITNAIRELKEVSKDGTDIGSDLDSEMLASLMPYVKEKLYIDENEEKLYSNLVRWCLDNRLLQQALTIYTEKIPLILLNGKGTDRALSEFEKVFLVSADKVKQSLKEKKFGDALYSDLFDIVRPEAILAMERFGQICQAAADCDFGDRSGYIRKIREESAAPWYHESERKAAEDLCSYIEIHFDDECRLRKTENEMIYGQNVNQKKVQGFLNTLKGNAAFQHYFLYRDERAYHELSKRKDGTYQKKIQSLKRICDASKSSEAACRFYEVMSYYLAVKIIRNRVNHAEEGEDTQDRKSAVEFLIGNRILPVSFSNEKNAGEKYRGIEEVVRKGLESAEIFCKWESLLSK